MVSKILWEEDEQMSITGQILIIDMKGFNIFYKNFYNDIISKKQELLDTCINDIIPTI